MIPDFEMNKEN